MKFHLKRVVGAQKLTFEELTSTCILGQIEACMNSRPITNVTSHSDDVSFNVLTPRHFLIGRSLVSFPTRNFSTEKLTLLKRWSLCQALVQHWWKRWSSEYLQQLQILHKWRKSTRDIQPDDIVLVKEDNMVTNHWPLARVVSTFPGHDGKTRVELVRTKTRIYKRPITKLVLLLSSESSKGDSAFGGRYVQD